LVPLFSKRFKFYPRHCRVPHIPDFLWSFVGSLNFMRLSSKRAAHAVLSRAAYRKFGASRCFSRDVEHRRPSPQTSCGPHNSVRVPYVRTSVRGPKTVGEAQPKLLVPGPPCVHVEAEESWAFAHPSWGEPATISLETTALHIKIQPHNPLTGEKSAESYLTFDSLRYIVRYIVNRRRIYVWTRQI
jgi:hypothetical protein